MNQDAFKIGIATCSDKPELGEGDRGLLRALEKLGAQVSPLIWTDAEASFRHWDAVIVRSVWDYHHRPQQFMTWIEHMAQPVRAMINPAETIRWNIDKTYLLELIDRGVPCVPSLLIAKNESVSTVREKIWAQGWGDCVIKPTVSATAFLTFRSAPDHPQLPEQIAQVQRQSDVLVQPYVSSIQSDGEISLIFFRGERALYSHAIIKHPRAGDFRVQADFGGRVERFEPDEGTIAFAEEAMRAVTHDWTFARVDILDWKTRPLIGEIELIEPDLFLQVEDAAADRLARAVFFRMSCKI